MEISRQRLLWPAAPDSPANAVPAPVRRPIQLTQCIRMAAILLRHQIIKRVLEKEKAIKQAVRGTFKVPW